MPDPPSSPDALNRFVGWLASVLKDLVGVMSDAEGGPVLLAELGWSGNPPAIPPDLLTRLDQVMESGTNPAAQAADTFAEFVLALTALANALASAGADASTAFELVGDALDVIVTQRLKTDHPGVWAILRLLSLVTDDGAQLSALGNLIGDARTYLSGLVSGPGYQQTWQDYSAAILGAAGIAGTFIPNSPEAHGHDVSSFRSEIMYGWSPASNLDHPNLMTVLGRTLTWRLDAQAAHSGSTPGAEEIVDLTFALVPGEHNRGSWGLFVRLAGQTSLTIPLGKPKTDPTTHQIVRDPYTGEVTPTGWQLTLSFTDGIPLVILFAGNGFLRAAGPGPGNDFTASIAVERPDDVPGSTVLGNANGTHVEIQHGRLAVKVANDGNGWLFDANAHADHIILNIAIPGDSFLRAVLPQQLRFDSTLGAGVDTRRGFYLEGGVALVADLPVNLTVGPAAVAALHIQGLHLRLAISADDPNNTGRPDTSFSIGLTVDASVVIAGGVLSASVAGVGAKYAITQHASGVAGAGSTDTAGNWSPSLSGVPPNGLGLAIKAGPVSGGGYIGYDPDRGEYTGALQLHVGLAALNVDIVALGMLDTRIPGHDGDWALLLILAAQFTPGIQLGLGFTLSGLGGVLGINHTLDSDAIAAGLRTKSLDTILFPPDPVAQAPHIFAVWRQTMPLADGHVIVGPMVQIGWGGAANLCTLELAILIELDPSPVQLVLLGSFRFVAPTNDLNLIRLRADVLGRLTFDPVDFLLQAELVDSRLGTFTISGGLVIEARGGDDAAFVLTVGGYNPHFTPPANVPVPDRIRVDISGSDNPRLRLEAYVAITSQSFQFGARVELHAAAGPLALDGWLGLDALIQWLPTFRFSVEISAGLSLSFDGSPVLEVSIDVLLEGPGPWHVKGYASLTLLFFTLSLPIDAHWGDDAEPTTQTAQPLDLVRAALSVPDAWSATLPSGASSIVILKQATGTTVPAHPLAVVTCHQRAVPLGLTITHVGNLPLAAPTTVDLSALTLAATSSPDATPVTDVFASGQFLTLTDDQALSKPSFEPMRAGLSAGGSALDTGNATAVATTYKTIAVDGATRTQRPPWLLAVEHADRVLRPAPVAVARPIPNPLTTQPDTLRTMAGIAAAQTSALASQAAAAAGGARLFDAVSIAGAGA
jgi:hypothetical protein